MKIVSKMNPMSIEPTPLHLTSEPTKDSKKKARGKVIDTISLT